MNRSPANYPNSGIPQVSGWPQNLMPPRTQGFPSGSNRSDTDAEMLLSSAVAWWDASQYRDGDRFLRNLGMAGDLLDARIGSSDRITTSNDPKYLAVEDRSYVYFPGVTGNHIWTAVRVLSSLSTWDFAVRVTLDRTGVGETFGGIDSTHAYLALQNDNTLWIRYINTSLGSIGGVASSIPVPGIAQGIPVWLRGRVTIATAVCEYWYSYDRTNDESQVTWIKLGTDVTGTNAGTAPLLTFSNGGIWGSWSGGLSGFAGRLHAGVERVDGEIRQILDLEKLTSATTTSFNIASGNGVKQDGLVLTGISGQYASTPDTPALSITGDIDIKVNATLTDWTPSGSACLVSKHDNTSNRSYFLFVDGGGTLTLSTSADGVNQDTGQSSAVTGFADGTRGWVRATLDVDDGAGNRVYKFYTSSNGITWTQLGVTQTVAGATSIINLANSLAIGTRSLGSQNNTVGTIHRVIIENGYDGAGVAVFDADFEAQAIDTVAFNATSATGIKSGALVLRGVSQQRASTPSSTALNAITGDIEFVVRASLRNWSSGTFFGKGYGNQWWGYMNTNIYLSLVIGGTIYYNNVPWPSKPANDAIVWIKMTRNSSTGVFSFYWAADQATEPSSWTLIGTTTGVTGALTTTTQPLGIGCALQTGGSFEHLNGSIYRVIIRNGIDGPVAFDADFSTKPDGTLSFTEASPNVATVTIDGGTNPLVTMVGTNPSASINRPTSGRKAVVMPSRWNGGRSCFLFGTDDYMEVVGSWQHQLLNIGQGQDFSLILFLRQWNTTLANGRYLNKWSGSVGTPGYFIDPQDTANTPRVEFFSSTGLAPQVAVSGASTNGLPYVIGFSKSKDVTVMFRNLQFSSTMTNNFDMSNTNPFLFFRTVTGAYQEVEFYAAAVFRRALTPAEIATIVRYYGAA